jgi:hypothetical protein
VYRGHLRPQPRRHHLVELAQGAQRRFADARHAAARGQSQAHRHRHRLVGIEQQRWQRRARAQLIAAAVALAGLHRVTEVPQPLHITAHAARRHPEPLGQFLTRPHPPRLEQPQQLQQPARRFGHPTTLTQS